MMCGKVVVIENRSRRILFLQFGLAHMLRSITKTKYTYIRALKTVETRDECKAQVNQYSGATYKKFSSLAEANNFIGERGGSSVSHQSSSYNAKPYSGGYSRGRAEPQEYYSANASGSDSYNYTASSTSTKGFVTDHEGRVDIYTDGACSSNGNRNATAGIGVYFGNNHAANVSKPVRGRVTNNSAEIEAVTEAARVARQNGLSKIRINTDSEFLINCKTKWMSGWKARDWKTADNKPVINKEELLEMEKALAPLDVEFNHVRGHAGVHGNEMADKLARAGAEQYRK